MKYLRYLDGNTIKPAILINHIIYDISQYISDITQDTISALENLNILLNNNSHSLPIITKKIDQGKIKACIKTSGKIIAIGMNYIDHLERVDFLGGERKVPEHFIFFQKPTSSITGPYDPIYVPRGTHKVDYENELGVIIGKPAKYVSEAEAEQYIAGFCIVNDVSERTLQLQKPGQYNMGKSCDSFCPIGPYIVTPDELTSNNLQITTKVNGHIVQNGTTKNMIFSIPNIISTLSNYFTLYPGDIIATGTPMGVQLEEEFLGNKPNYLKNGDSIELSIEGLGTQKKGPFK